LTNRLRSRERLLRHEDERLHILYELVREIASAGNRKDYLEKITARLGSYLGGHCSILLTDEQKNLTHATPLPDDVSMSEKERAVAVWVLENGKAAGWSTTTLASTESLYLPLRSATAVMGIFLFKPRDPSHKLLPDEENILQAVIQQLSGIFIKETHVGS
jgi:two-component system, OmpR family, sensor histidine kinase KdpD